MQKLVEGIHEFQGNVFSSKQALFERLARIMKENYQHITEATPRLTATVEENVLVRLENLRTHPSVAAALARDALKLHGWVYKFETGQVYGYDAQQGQYVAVDQATALPGRVLPQLPAI